jgi:DHA1 family bicyclomycin/chloramphenicol resistance-like MFS transporter
LAQAFLVQGISPLLAPVLGGALLQYMSWRWLFAVIGMLAVIAAALSASKLAETHPPARRLASSGGGLARSYARLLRNRRFMAMSLVAGSATAGAFAFLTALPFILAHRYGFGPTAIGATVALVAGSQIIFTQLCPRLLRRWEFEGHLTRVTAAGVGLAAALGIAVALPSIGVALFLAVVAGLFGTYGLLLTPGAVGALDAAPNDGGAASALLGTLQLLCAAVASMLLSVAPAGALWPVALATCICTGVAAGAAWLARQPSGRRA